MAQNNISKPENNTEKNENGNVIFDMNIFAVDFTKGIKRFWYIVVVLTVLLGVVFGFFKYKSYVPMYKSSVSFSVRAVSYNSNGSEVSVYYYDNISASQLSKTFPYIVNTSMMTNAIKDELNKNYINGTISAESVTTDSNIFKVTVTSNSAQDAFDIINAVINVYPEVAIYVLGNVELNILIKPTLPDAPYTVNSFIRTGAIMALVGATLGFGLIGIFAFFRNTVRKKEDFKNKLNQKCYVEVPLVIFHRKSNDKNIKNRLVRITEKHPTYKESFRLLRKRLSRNLKHNEKVVGISSAAPGEGKTTVSFNIAHAFAISGKKVACVDLDARVRGLQRYFDANGKQCYSDMFANDGNDFASLANTTEENLDLYFAGNAPIDFTEAVYEDFFKYLNDKYDYIIVNLPMGSDISYCVSASNLCDCTMLVVKQDTTSVDKIRKTLESLSFSSARILGFVFNCVQDGFSGYGSYYYGGKYGYGKYGYGKRYGYGKYGYGKYGYGKYGYGSKEYGYGYGYGYGYDKGEDDEEYSHGKKHNNGKSKTEISIDSVSDDEIPDNND